MSGLKDESSKKKAPISSVVWNQCWTVLMEMMKDRQWRNIVPASDVDTLYNQYRNARSLVILLASAEKAAEPSGCRYCAMNGESRCRLSVFVVLTSNFTSPALQHIETLRHDVSHLIVIFQDKVTATLRDDFFRLKKYELELKPFSQLYVNVSKHQLVPRHRRLTEVEETELLALFRCTRDKIPSILVTDPVVRYYNFPVGSLLEIERPPKYYRHVVFAVAKTNYEKFFCD